MATWSSLVVLSLAVVSTLSFPRPDAEYKIPTVGLGSRAQYYVLHSDGTFKYGYDTGNGAYEQSMAQAPSEVSGAFGYRDPTGADIKLEYTADDRGFIARGDHLPVAPERDFGAKVRGATDYAASHSKPAAAVLTKSVPVVPEPVVPVEVANVRSAVADDGSYSFSYETSSSSRSESADASNSVIGEYAFTADDGINRAIKYIAGSATGFIAEGNSLPKGPSVPGAESGIPTGRILPVFSEDEANEFARSTSSLITAAHSAGVPVPGTYSAPIAPAPSAIYTTRTVDTGSGDASYTFSYDAGDSSRSESADTDLNVKGTYSFLPPEGHRLTVNYVAGSDTGFVATGDHLPVAPDADFGSRGSGTAVISSASAYSAPSAIGQPAPSSIRAASTLASSAPIDIAEVRSAAGDDGSYSFAYETSSSSRAESGDSQNSVTGKYSFVADDGINREIKYTAGAETGYIAEGDSLPIGPSVPGAENGIPAGLIFPILSEEEANELARATSTAGDEKHSTGFAPATTYSAARPSAVATTRTTAGGSRDASYSFSYDADDSSRSESSDADLNVKGTYSFLPPKGHRLTVNYIAGSDTGFVATGDHLPVAPDADFSARTNGIAAASSISQYSAPAANVPQPAPVPSEVAQVRSATGSDGSYSFSYDASDSSRSESADADLNVKGTYSFLPPGGDRLTVNYIAGSDTGFVATGNHLPVAPDVHFGARTGADSSSASQYSAPTAIAPFASALPAAPVPSEVAQVRSATGNDGSYSFSYENSDSSRSETADSQNEVMGRYSFIADDGINREITYTSGISGFIAEGDSLPQGPPVPGAESGIPTGRILPILYTGEANALSGSSFEGSPTHTVKTGASNNIASVPADASYSFSFASDTYSRDEKADADGNIVGSYTYVDENGKEHTIKFVAGRETGFLPEGYPTPEEHSFSKDSSASVPGPSAVLRASSATTHSVPVTAHGGSASATKYSTAEKTASSASGYSSEIISDVLLHRYDAGNSDKYGYAFTAVRR